ncbi:hypothetical protein B0H12DRAFT_411067 [Mycena haematopus]|nr:hypothetical protein B0H12DRAFT_411067 [Mycena haematopus]
MVRFIRVPQSSRLHPGATSPGAIDSHSHRLLCAIPRLVRLPPDPSLVLPCVRVPSVHLPSPVSSLPHRGASKRIHRLATDCFGVSAAQPALMSLEHSASYFVADTGGIRLHYSSTHTVHIHTLNSGLRWMTFLGPCCLNSENLCRPLKFVSKCTLSSTDHGTAFSLR